MNWNQGFSAKYYVNFVDPQTWGDRDRLEITEGSIKRSDSGIGSSADLTCINYDSTVERWVRVWLDARQSGSSEHIPLFTGLATAPEKDVDGRLINNTLTCYSSLKPCQDVMLPLGYYATAGIQGAELVRQLLAESTPAPIIVTGESPALSKYIIAEENENHLTMIEKILSAINWRLRLHGDGTVEVCSMSTEPKVKFDALENDSIEPKLKAVNDWYGCPNVFRAVVGDTSAVARDDSPTSPLSTVNRGREIWAQERDCNLNANETLAEYAVRRLKEEQRHYLAVDYDRRFHPDLLVSDLVRLHYPEQGIDGVFYISEQSIELEYGARTGEEVVQI